MATAQELAQKSLGNTFSESRVKSRGESRVKSRVESRIDSRVAARVGQDLDTSEGLYRVAHQKGLKSQADKILGDNSGESMKKIFSGGFISDVFDVLNMDSYGMVGMLKGGTFEKGILNRESFSDADSLGRYGLTGSIAGIVMDIAVSPTTYIAPWTLLGKIPGVAKGAKFVKEAAIGKMVTKDIIGGKTYQVLDGGLTVPARFNPVTNKEMRPILELGEKIQYMFGADSVFKNIYDESRRAVGISTVVATNLLKPLFKMDDAIASKLITQTAAEFEGGVQRFARKNIDILQRELDAETFAKVKPAWDKIDSLGKELVDLGVLSKGQFEENVGVYLRNSYTEFETRRAGRMFGFKPIGIRGTKARSPTLTAKGAEALGQIDNPAYLLRDTMLRMSRDVEDAKLFKAVNEHFATKVAQDGFVQIPNTAKYQTSIGAISELATEVKGINKAMTPLLSDLKSTFKADRKVMSEISSLEKELASMSTMRSEELTKFFNYGATGAKVVQRGRVLGTIPDKLVPLSNQVRKFDTFDDFWKSDAGLQAEKLDLHGDLQRLGYPSVKDFYNRVKNPYKAADEVNVGAISKSLDAEFNFAYGLSVKSDIVQGTARTARDTKPVKDISGLPIKSRIKQSVRPAGSESTIKDLDLLAKKIRDFNAGFRTGAKATKEGIAEMQSAAIKVIKKNFSVADSGKFLSKVKNATDPKQLETLIDDLSKDFFNIHEKTIESLGQKNLSKARLLQKSIEQLGEKSGKLSELTKRSIDDSFRHLEQNINDLRFEKTDLLDAINMNKAGQLAGKYIPKQMADYVNDIISPVRPTGAGIVGVFKFAKVLLSPAAHIRNMMSNPILNWWKLGIGPWNVHKYAEAVKDIATDSPMWLRAKAVGGGGDTFAANELDMLLDDPSMNYLGKTFGKYWNFSKQKIGDIYQHEESWAKLVAFKEMLKKGMSDKDAWLAAESATFNYAQVTPFIRRVRQSIYGVPFITFPLKATPLVIETALKHPQRIAAIGKIKNAIEQMSDIKETEAERASEPQWVKNGFYFKLPWKDGNGRSAYFDLTYVLPFGDIISGSYFTQAMLKDTGTKEAPLISLLSKNPAFQLLKELSRNQDFGGNEIWKPSDPWEKVAANMNLHIMRTMLPPILAAQIPKAGKVPVGLYSAINLPQDEPSLKRNFLQELSSYIGLKVQPMDAEISSQINEYNKVKGLRTLLKDNNVMKDFTKGYIPK